LDGQWCGRRNVYLSDRSRTVPYGSL